MTDTKNNLVYCKSNELKFNQNDQVCCFLRGGGDTFNAFIHAFGNGNKKIEQILIKEHQVELILLLMKRFNIEADKIYVTENTTKKHNTLEIIKTNNPNIDYYAGHTYYKQLRGVIELIVIYWMNYKWEGKINPSEIREKLTPKQISKFSIPANAVVITDYSVYEESYSREKINAFILVLKEMGFTNFVINSPKQKGHYSIPSYDEIEFVEMSHSDLINEAYSRNDLVFLGPRSGLFDIIRFSQNIAIVIYHSENNFQAWFSLQRIGNLIQHIEVFHEPSDLDSKRLRQFLLLSWKEDALPKIFKLAE